MSAVGSMFGSMFEVVGSGSGSGGAEPLGLALYIGGDGAGSVIVQGDILTISAPHVHAGTYDLSAVDVSGGPVFLAPPTYSGTLGTGNTLTAVNGLVVSDPDDGPVTFSVPTWAPLIGTASQGATRVQAADDSLGLSISQTATNSAGTSPASSSVITGATFSEQRITGGRLTLVGGLGRDQVASPISEAIVMTSYIWRSASGGPIFDARNPLNGNFDSQFMTVGHGATNWRVYSKEVRRDSDGLAVVLFQTGSETLQDGDRLDILSAVQIGNQTDVLGSDSARGVYRINGGEWQQRSQANSKLFDSLTIFDTDALRVGASQSSQTTILNHELIRHAIWIDVACDPFDADQRGRFFSASAVQPMALAVADFGDPWILFDDLTAMQTGANQGTLAGAWTVGGTWSNVA